MTGRSVPPAITHARGASRGRGGSRAGGTDATRLLLARRVALAGVVIVAVIVRLAGIGDRLSADEGYSWLVASAPDAARFLDRLAAYENTPPLHYLLLTPLPLDDEAWLRVPAATASVAAVPVLYCIVRPLAGTAAALLSALGLAVAPYHVSFANYSRAFMLAGLGLLLAVWAAARLAQGRGRRWWWLWGAGSIVALYSEYDAGLFLVAVTLAVLVIGTPGRRETLVLAPLPVLPLLPWIPQLLRSLDAIDETKVAPTYPGPGLASVRDLLVPLAFGEHGAAGGTLARSGQLIALVAAAVVAAALVRRRSPPAFWLLPGLALGVLLLHGAVALAGPDVFASRYLTILIPLLAATLAVAISSLPWRWATPAAAVALGFLAVAVFVTRHGRELEPDPRTAAPAVRAAGGRTVLTNSAVVAFYLRDLDPIVDRPFGLGTGRGCGRGCAALDDTRVAGGPRPGLRELARAGPYSIRARP